MINWANNELNSTFTGRDRSLLEKVQSFVTNIKEMLETENLREFTDETLYNLAEQVREIIKVVRNIPEENIHLYLLSKEAMLRALRSAAIELNLALDQLTSRGKTPCFYKNLLAFQEYFEKALEQMLETTNEEDREGQRYVPVIRGNYDINAPTSIFFVQIRKYRDKLIDTHHSLLFIYRLLSQEKELWLDQESRAIAVLETMRDTVRVLCKILERSIEVQLPTDTALRSSHLIVALYYADEQAYKLISLMSAFHSNYQPKPRPITKMRQEVHAKFDLLVRNCDDIVQKLQRLTFM